MTTTIFKRRSISLDDKTYKIGNLVAKNKAVSLSALLRLMINEAYEQCPRITQRKMAFDVAEYQRKIGTDHRLPSPHLFSTKHLQGVICNDD